MSRREVRRRTGKNSGRASLAIPFHNPYTLFARSPHPAMREAKKIKGYNNVRQHKGVAYLREKKPSMNYTNSNSNGFLTKPRKNFVSNPSKLVPVQDMPWVHSKEVRGKVK